MFQNDTKFENRTVFLYLIDMNEYVMEKLKYIDEELRKRHIFWEITVIGASALILNNIKIDRKTDCDIINREIPEQVEETLKALIEKSKIENTWLNNEASSIYPLPEGFEERLQVLGHKNRILGNSFPR